MELVPFTFVLFVFARAAIQLPRSKPNGLGPLTSSIPNANGSPNFRDNSKKESLPSANRPRIKAGTMKYSGNNGNESQNIQINFNIENLNVDNDSHAHQEQKLPFEPMGRSSSDSGLKKESHLSNERRPSGNKFVIRQASTRKTVGPTKVPPNGVEAKPPSREESPATSPQRKQQQGLVSSGKPTLKTISQSRVFNHENNEQKTQEKEKTSNPFSPMKKQTFSSGFQAANSSQSSSLRLSHNSSKKLTLKSKVQNEEEKNSFFRGLAVKTKAGWAQRNVPKTNQDSFVFLPSFDPLRERSLFGILDGHGMFGHHVSQFVKATLPKHIEGGLRQLNEATDDDYCSVLKQSYIKTLDALQKSSIDCFVSGTTAVNCLVTKDKIYCANAGDSRAIMLREEEGKGWSLEALSEDHKPDLESERKRIIQSGGRVEPFRGKLKIFLENGMRWNDIWV